ncbi:hypothetical protein ESCO_004666 [Escovopsis weberi]|uniref:DUF1275 domain protein n=1 Tax=Escovopsis weberi TaxID=150374 RepID=A0A0M9VRS8_ESCWE|nr:hypothetical protein ESCO_004666 [Escovopsis weberi]
MAQEKEVITARTSLESPPDSRLQTPNKADNPAPGSSSRLVNHFCQDIRTSVIVEIQLLILTFCTGIQDATSFPDYHCFASNQTGNTVFLCLALVIPSFDGQMFYTANIGISLGLFLAAGWLTGQLGHLLGPRRRWFLAACNLLQSALVLLAAGLQWRAGVYGPGLPPPGEDHGPTARAVIGLLAAASGSQVVQSRSLAATEISTAMATAAWVDLLIDRRLLVLNNRPRTRRASFLLALAAGSLLGALMYRTVGSAWAVAVSAIGKLLVTAMYLFVRGETKGEKKKQEALPA